MKTTLLLCLCLFGCDERSRQQQIEESRDIIMLDGCEYIGYRYSSGESASYTLTHKGNCANPVHDYNLERKTF